jgi:hypothetical protein
LFGVIGAQSRSRYTQQNGRCPIRNNFPLHHI